MKSHLLIVTLLALALLAPVSLAQEDQVTTEECTADAGDEPQRGAGALRNEDGSYNICYQYTPEVLAAIEAIEAACPDVSAPQDCAQAALDDQCPEAGTFPDCLGIDVQAADGFVAGFVIPTLRTQPDGANPVALGPTITFDGHDIVVEVDAVESVGGAWADYAGPLDLYVQIDCGALHDAIKDVVTCASPQEFVTATPVRATAAGGHAAFSIPRQSITGNAFPDGPVSAVHFFVAKPGETRYSDFFTPKDTLMRAELFDAADAIDHQTFTPVLLVDGTQAVDPIEVAVTATDGSAAEGTALNDGRFTFSRTGGVGDNAFLEEVTVSFKLEGTAVLGSDYTLTPAVAAGDVKTIKIAPMAASATLTVTPINDALDASATEDVKVTVLPTEAYVVKNNLQVATVTIADNIIPVVSLRRVGEASTLQECTLKADSSTMCTTDQVRKTVTFEVERSTVNDPLSVQLAYASGAGQAAISDVDSTTSGGVPSQLNFVAGVARRTITLVAQQDAETEGLETLAISIVSSTAYQTSATENSVSFAIFDDELPLATATPGNANIAEGSGTSSFTIGRAAADTSGPLDVKFKLGGSATRGDTPATGDYHLSTPATLDGPDANGVFTVTIPASQSSVTLAVTSHQDTTKEGTEPITLTLQPAGAYQVGSVPVGVNILDDDLPLIKVEATDNQATEAAGANRTGQFRVTRTPATDPSATNTLAALDVNVTFSGSPTAADYTAKNGTTPITGKVSFPAGKKQVNITIDAVNDSDVEPLEGLVLSIRPAPSGAGLLWGVGTPSQATVTLVSEDNLSPAQDTDQDGVPNVASGTLKADNCRDTKNPDQENADGDAQGDACDADDDNDGLSDVKEAELGTKALERDTDLDGRSDGQEVTDKTDPKNLLSPSFAASAVAVTSTGHGVNITWEAPRDSLASRYLVFMASGEPTLVDTVPATMGRATYQYTDTKFPGGEHEYYVQAMLPTQTGSVFNATLASTSDQAKIDLEQCKALAADADADGLCDAQEVTLNTDPNAVDTDADGLTDRAEVESGTDPLVPNTTAGGEVSIVRETPFWVGLILLVATLVGLFVGIGMSRRKAGADAPNLANIGEPADTESSLPPQDTTDTAHQ